MWDSLFVSSRASHVRDLSRGIQGAPTEDIKDPGELLGGRSGERTGGRMGAPNFCFEALESCVAIRIGLSCWVHLVAQKIA